MLKIVLIVALCALLFSGRNRLGGIVRALRGAPKRFREGQDRAEDPASYARPLNAPPHDPARGDDR